MTLKKKYIHRNHEKGQAMSQITLDDDFNISDNKPDMVKVIQDKGEIKLDEVKVNEGHIWVKGTLEFCVLYKSDQSEMRISYLTGSIPFQENLSMDDVDEADTVRVKTEIEDLSIGIINSRKLSIRALVVLKAGAEEVKDEAVSYGIEDEEGIEKKVIQKEVLQLIMAKRDNCRFKNEIMIPSNKPNVAEVLWKSVQLRGMETRLKDGKISLTGEALVFVIYNGTEDEEKLQWIENSVPLHGEVECNVPEEELIFQISFEPGAIELEVKPDYDGEERILNLDVVLDLNIHIWKEEPVEILEDLYSLKENIVPEYEESSLEKLLVKNYTKCKMQERIEIPKEDGNVLQICSCSGKAMIESSRITPKGVEVEGTLTICIMFVTAEDSSPIGSKEAIIPFSQMIEVENIEKDIRIELESGLEQLSAILIDNSRVEIKAVINLNLIAFARQQVQKIKEVREEELDLAQLQQCPGITGYIVKEKDSMWNIAKENHTTIQNIMETNQLKSAEIEPGEKILIVKAV